MSSTNIALCIIGIMGIGAFITMTITSIDMSSVVGDVVKILGGFIGGAATTAAIMGGKQDSKESGKPTN
jgi:hypothetical protein